MSCALLFMTQLFEYIPQVRFHVNTFISSKQTDSYTGRLGTAWFLFLPSFYESQVQPLCPNIIPMIFVVSMVYEVGIIRPL